MAYLMAATAVTLNDLEGHSPLADVFKCNPWNICVAFYTIQLTMCSHGSSALEELLVFCGVALCVHGLCSDVL